MLKTTRIKTFPGTLLVKIDWTMFGLIDNDDL